PVLVAPLDWGLGHATRCMHIINALLAANARIIIAASGMQAGWLQQQYPSLKVLRIPGYKVRYAKRGVLLPWVLLQQLPRIIRTIKAEHRWLQQAVKKYNIDIVLSDNRYGLHTKQVPCIFITHQLTIATPTAITTKIVQRINYCYIQQFSACWVPDVRLTANALAGTLSHPQQLPTIPVHYIGWLSRLQSIPQIANSAIDFLVMLSGPEPQRTILETSVIKAAAAMPEKKFLLLRALPQAATTLAVPDNVTAVNHADAATISAWVAQAEYIVTRSGYTTLMEVLPLGKRCICIPTPGQTEQGYLATYLMQRRWVFTVRQSQFSEAVLKAALSFEFAVIPPSTTIDIATLVAAHLAGETL
ncbi:MAG TPA: glycosyl transferase family 28, partial [Chitinophagaceae bacterium]|nr:glycosyl transferase family 28 [Chitinophagaceae bacterium]